MRLVALVAAFGCGSSAVTPREVRARIDSDLGNVLHAAKAAADGITVPGGAAFALVGLAAPTSGDPDAAIRWLDDRLFTDANFLGDGIFKVPPELLCAPGDAACAMRVDRAGLRLRVADASDTLEVAVQLGAAHDEPLTFELGHDELDAQLVLDGAAPAAAALAGLYGAQAPIAATSGQVSARLRANGPARASLDVTIDRAIALELDDGADVTRLASPAGPVVSLGLDGGTGDFALDLGLGATTLHTPTSDVAVAATAIAELGGGALRLAHLTLATTLARGGAPALAIQLAPLDGAIAADGTLTVSPRLDLRRTIDHAVLGDAPPLYDITGILLDGTLRATASQLAMLAGTLAVTTAPAQYGFDATAGQCVAGDALTACR